MLAVTTKRGGSFMRELRSRLITSVAILFVIGFMGFLGMDNAAHIGGFAVGFGLGKIFVDPQPINSREKQRPYAPGSLPALFFPARFAILIPPSPSPPPSPP